MIGGLMAKKLNDDEAMEMAYRKLFGDLDNIESRSMFDSDDVTPNDDVVKNAEPEMKGSGGVKVTIEPLMVAAEEGAKMHDDAEDEEKEDKLKGIGGMSSLMSQLHGAR